MSFQKQFFIRDSGFFLPLQQYWVFLEYNTIKNIFVHNKQNLHLIFISTICKDLKIHLNLKCHWKIRSLLKTKFINIGLAPGVVVVSPPCQRSLCSFREKRIKKCFGCSGGDIKFFFKLNSWDWMRKNFQISQKKLKRRE